MPRYSEGRVNPRSWAPRRFDVVGDGSGATNANGNYSDAGVGPTFFRVRADHRELLLTGITIKVRDNGQLTAEKYGAMDELANGVTFGIMEGESGIIVDMTAGEAITTNASWADFTTNVVFTDFGAGDNFVTAGFRLPDPDEPVYLPAGFSFYFRFHDDMSGLVRQSMFAFGRYVRGFG